MSKLYFFPALFFCLIAAGCKKNYIPYCQSYTVHYYPHTDSMVAYAIFLSDDAKPTSRVLLSKKESISFNGKDADYVEYDTYVWKMKGRHDARFVLERNKEQMVSSASESILGTYEIICPDTVSKAKGFTIKIKGYTAEKKNNLGFNIHHTDLSIPGGGGYSVQSDSLHFSPSEIAKWTEGEMVIVLNETQKGIVSPDENVGGVLLYNIQLREPVYLVK